MAPTKQEVAQQFLRRREKNLRYFQKAQPALFKHFQSFRMNRVEVQVGTEGADVDLVVDGQSWYQGGAKAQGKEEAKQFLEEYRPGKKVHSMTPVFAETKVANRFVANHEKKCLSHSHVTRENFEGFKISNFLPSVVFMGVGLGYHIEAVTQKADIVDAIIFEPDDEVFAASLFTIDWESVCQRFQGRKGYSLRFLITPAGWADQRLQEYLESEVHKSVPLFPVITSYFNHRSQSRMKALAQAIARDAAGHLTSWGNYESELRRLNNMLHNTRQDLSLLKPESVQQSSLPVLIVGSGPSIDGRIEQIKQVRSQVILVSAGTGIRALTANGLSPDFHVELDPHYLIYGHLSQVNKALIADTTLLAVAEINPLVPELFRHCHFYVKDRSPYPGLFGVQDHAFRFCYPTCTNAALSLFVQLGFSNLFLLGCDYGFKSLENHHSEASVYGESDTSEVSHVLKQRSKDHYKESTTFLTEGVDGGQLYTKPDYHAGKKEMEAQIRYWKVKQGAVQVSNCSDGAVIEGAPWLDGQAFVASIRLQGAEAPGPDKLRSLLPTSLLPADPVRQHAIVDEVSKELRQRTAYILDALKSFQLRGKKDISRAARFVSVANHKVGASPAQRTSAHLVSGTVKWFLVSSYSHAMAHEDGEALKAFLKGWQTQFNGFLREIPEHFQSNLNQEMAASADPLVNNMNWENEADTALTGSGEGDER